MTDQAQTPRTFGRDVLGPIVAEFCLRLWSLGSLMNDRDDFALLFCARGGLRLKLAYERFLVSSQLASPLHVAPLMVSRLVAIRPALMRTVEEDLDSLLPAAGAALTYEFPRATIADVARAMTGFDPGHSTTDWDNSFSSPEFARMLKHSDGRMVVEALAEQASLFKEHLHCVLGDRRHAVLVDTGLYGTTMQLLAEGVPAIDFSSALLARSNYRRGPGGGKAAHHSKVYGLSVESDGYSMLRRRSSMLRYWHFIEWLFEPDLSSVRSFRRQGGEVRSNLEEAGWAEKIFPSGGSAFEGVLDYIDGLPSGPAERIVQDAHPAWGHFRQAIVWPNRADGYALSMGSRSNDFGSDVTWTARSWQGPLASLRGSSPWREGEIARSGTAARLPLLAAIEVAYNFRRLKHGAVRRWRSG